jgi:hypothetical protein
VLREVTKDHCVIFTRFNTAAWEGGQPPLVWEDTHCPILASIATLRAANQSVVIYVLDSEPLLEQWGEFPALLNFRIVQFPNQVPIPYNGGHPFQRRMVSRIWDIWAFAGLIPERHIVYADSDIFWRKDPFPLARAPLDRFYGDSRSDGFFYFDKGSPLAEVFVNCWRALALAGSVSDEFRTTMRLAGYHSPMYLCEMSYCYLIRNGMTNGWSEIDHLENYFPCKKTDPIDMNARCLHAHSGLFFGDRLRVARSVVEFNQAIRSVLPQTEADLLLGTDTPTVDFANVLSLG